MPRKPTLTPKKAAFARSIVRQYVDERSFNQTVAAKEANPDASDKNARIIGNQLMGDTHVQAEIKRLLAKAGLTPERWAARLAEALYAKEHKFAQFEGKFTDERVVDDWPSTLRAAELIGKAGGMLPKEDGPTNSTIILHLPEAPLTVGHASDCSCPECQASYNSRVALTVPDTTDAQEDT